MGRKGWTVRKSLGGRPSSKRNKSTDSPESMDEDSFTDGDAGTTVTPDGEEDMTDDDDRTAVVEQPTHQHHRRHRPMGVGDGSVGTSVGESTHSGGVSGTTSSTGGGGGGASAREVIESAFGKDADLYSEVLGVEASATPSQIQGAFYDRRYELYDLLSGGGESQRPAAQRRMEAVAAAYKLLSDPEGRSRYDSYRSRKVTAVAASGAGQGQQRSRPAGILRNRSGGPASTPMAAADDPSRNVTPSPPRSSAAGGGGSRSINNDADDDDDVTRAASPGGGSSIFHPRLTMPDDDNTVQSDETETASNVSRCSSHSDLESLEERTHDGDYDDDDTMGTETDYEATDVETTDYDTDRTGGQGQLRRHRRRPRAGGLGLGRRASVEDDDDDDDGSIVTGIISVESADSILDNSTVGTIETNDDESYVRGGAKLKRRGRSIDSEGTGGTFDTAGGRGGGVSGGCGPVNASSRSKSKGKGSSGGIRAIPEETAAEAEETGPACFGMAIPTCGAIPACRGAMACVRDEVTGSMLDTASAIDQVFNVFTLKDDEIDAIANELDGVGADLRQNYRKHR